MQTWRAEKDLRSRTLVRSWRPANKREAGRGLPEATAKRGTAPAISKEALSACVDAAPLAFLIIDRGGGIVLVNARAEELFGYGPGDLNGKPAGKGGCTLS